jgi:hypothetical protein
MRYVWEVRSKPELLGTAHPAVMQMLVVIRHLSFPV